MIFLIFRLRHNHEQVINHVIYFYLRLYVESYITCLNNSNRSVMRHYFYSQNCWKFTKLAFGTTLMNFEWQVWGTNLDHYWVHSDLYFAVVHSWRENVYHALSLLVKMPELESALFEVASKVHLASLHLYVQHSQLVKIKQFYNYYYLLCRDACSPLRGFLRI